MGMDVIGTNPKNKKGEYFRNNWWYWRPLWEFCEFVAPELTCQVEHAGSNDGDGLDGDNAKALGEALRRAIKAGVAKEYNAERTAWLESLPIRPCLHCEATGKRTWLFSPDRKDMKPAMRYDIMKALLDENALPEYEKEEVPEGWTEEARECNACGGTGGEQHWAKSYPFDEKNVSEFATFLVNCGGFQLW